LSQALQIAIVLANSRESDAMTKLADRKDKATACFEAIILVTGAKTILVSYISSPLNRRCSFSHHFRASQVYFRIRKDVAIGAIFTITLAGSCYQQLR
jgi:hypothetical protein